MSVEPSPAGRLESNTISLPSGRTNGRASSYGVLSSATGAGVPIHGPNARLT